MFLAFLNLGPTEIVLLLLLALVLFGADKAPELARSLGRARSELDRASREVKDALVTEDERALSAQLKFEAAREHQMREAGGDGELLALRRAAEELGIEAAGLDKAALKAAIAERLDTTAAKGGG